MLRPARSDREPELGSDVHHGLFDGWALSEHLLPVRVADVVEVDVDREPGHTEDEQVERRTAVQAHS